MLCREQYRTDLGAVEEDYMSKIAYTIYNLLQLKSVRPISTVVKGSKVLSFIRRHERRSSKHLVLGADGRALATPLLVDPEHLLSSLDTRKGHGAESRAHAVSTVDFGEFHTADDEAGSNLTGALDDGVFGSVHVEAAHAAELLDGLHGDHALD